MQKVKKTEEKIRLFLVADTHYYHKNILAYCDRPEGYETIINENWSKIVGKNDIVVHLGDVIFNNASSLKKMYKDLPGRKILVKGNHDGKTNSWYLRNGFDFVCDSFSIRHLNKKIIFTHEPLKDVSKFDLNIHGHLHDYKYEAGEQGDKNILISMEFSKYKPILLDNVIKYGKSLYTRV